MEAVRFELTDPFEPTVFKTVAISRTLPRFRKKENHSVDQPVGHCPVAVAVLYGAGKEARTPDIHVGNVVLYQLSYARNIGAPRQNRTAITGLQNQCTAIVLVGRNT